MIFASAACFAQDAESVKRLEAAVASIVNEFEFSAYNEN